MTEESPGCFNIEVIKKKTSQLIFLFLVIILSFACLIKKSLSDIKESGEITLLTKNNAHCYYSYRESPMGFEYELSMAFADYLGVDLRVITPGWPRMYAALNKGRGDFIAASLTITPEREKIVDFSDEYMSIQQQVIIHKDNPEIKQLDDLKEKTVHISKGSSYHERLLDLNEEGFEIELVLHKRTSTEEFIRQESNKYGFDRRLIAAIVYQESRFQPKAKSYTGVRGLMQITQRTAREMGIENRLDPVQSIQAGVKYLSKLFDRFKDVEGLDRMLLTLASYNVGYGHVKDAQIIAVKKGLNSKKWSSLESTLPLLSHNKYYREAKYGYTRGTEPVRFVKRIVTYYDIIKRMFLD